MRMIRLRLIGSGVMVSQAGAVESLVPAVVFLEPSASKRSAPSQIIALLQRASLSRSMLPSQAPRVLILKVRHIWEQLRSNKLVPELPW